MHSSKFVAPLIIAIGSFGTSNSGMAQQYAGPLTNCLEVFYDAGMHNWLALRNGCAQAIHVTWRGKNEGRGGGAADIGARRKTSTGLSRTEVANYGGFTYAVCPLGYIPVELNGRYWRNPFASFRCKK